jgi:hypothetical protein
MTLPPEFRDQWRGLPQLTGVQVVRRILEHERMTRSDIRAALDDVNILALEGEQLLAAVRNTSRYSLVRSILGGIRVWRLWSPSMQQLLDVAIWETFTFARISLQ